MLDIGLPHMNGHDLGRALRASRVRPRIVAITGDDRTETRARSDAAGFDAHLVKPVTPRAVADEVLRVMLDAAAIEVPVAAPGE